MGPGSGASEFLVHLSQLGPYLLTDEQAGLEMAQMLQRQLRCDALLLSQFDPLQRGYAPIVRIGYEARVLAHLNGWFMTNDPAMGYQNRHALMPARWGDYPFCYDESYSAQAFFKPAGFQDGVTLVLTNPWGNQTGALHINVVKKNTITQEHLDLMLLIRTMLGAQMDATNFQHQRPSDPQWNGFFLSDDQRHFVELSTRKGLDTNNIQQALREALLACQQVPQSGHIKLAGCWHQVRVQRKGDGHVVYWKAVPKPEITQRELDVATGLIRGRSNKEIAKDLDISESTVANYVENILLKTGSHSRTSAAIACDRALLSRAFQ